MAGRRQHYLPRFLQRAFRYRSQGDRDYVYSHETKRSYTPSTMGLGQERDFYGHPDLSPADSNITQGENRLAEIVYRLNKVPETVQQEDYALLIAALAVRTKKMREAMVDLVKSLATSMATEFDQLGMLKQEIESYWGSQSKTAPLIEEELRKHPSLNREQRAKLKAVVKQQWNQRKQEIQAQMRAGAQMLVNEFFQRMDRDSAKVADAAFRRIFEGDPLIPDRVTALKAYHFRIIDAPAGEFILGDCAVVGLRSDGTGRLATVDFDEENPLEHMFLPISPARCVVASRYEQSRNFSALEINRLSASLSHRFFISRSETVEALDDLKDLIGTAEPMAAESDIARLMQSVLMSKAS